MRSVQLSDSVTQPPGEGSGVRGDHALALVLEGLVLLFPALAWELQEEPRDLGVQMAEHKGPGGGQ